jgi:hypothetical protein
MRKTYKIKRVNKKKGGNYNKQRVDNFLNNEFSENGAGSLIKILNHLKQHEDTVLKIELSSNPQLFEELQIPITVDDSSLKDLKFEKINTEDIKKIGKDDDSTDGSSTDVSTDGSEHGIRGKTSKLSKFQNYIKSDTKKSYYAIPKNIDDLIEIVKYITSEIKKVKNKIDKIQVFTKQFTPEDKKTLDNAYLANIRITEFFKKNLSSYEDTLKSIEIEDAMEKRNEIYKRYGGGKYKNTRKRNKTHKSKK